MGRLKNISTYVNILSADNSSSFHIEDAVINILNPLLIVYLQTTPLSSESHFKNSNIAKHISEDTVP